ncbi:hypothetical protein GmHk_09G026030 [Glycine max]|nr:hypothetical protein GmHk_09G026030 [Glycine max]
MLTNSSFFLYRPMATPPASPPPPPPSPPPTVASTSPFTLKRTCKATRLRCLATRPPGAERPVVHVDPAIGKVDGSHKKKLRTYLGIAAHDKVDVTYETWKEVPTTQKDLIWKDIQDVRKKAQAIQKQNTTPHVLSRGGYEYLEHKLMAKKTKKKLEEAAQSRNTKGVIDPPSPIKRHMKWKMARTKKTGQMTSEATKEIADKIGPAGGVDYRKSDSAADVILQPDVVPVEITDPIIGLALPPKPEVGPSAARVSTKGSCVDPSPTNLDIGDADKCGLYIEEKSSRLVALGRFYEGSTVVHNIPLLHGQVKVGVEEVKDAEVPVPVPINEVILVGQTLNT